MKAEELRIGNLVYWNIPEKLNVLHEVVGIFQNRLQTQPISLGNSMEEYLPIPLTHEWLTKFGFQIRTIDYNLEADNYPCYEIFLLTPFTYDNYLRCNAKLNRWCIIQKIHDSDEEADWCEIMFSLKYVHQLQNLYFSLTGKELELKQ